MASRASSLVNELSTIIKSPTFECDSEMQTKAIALSRRLNMALKQPPDAALELMFWPGFVFCFRVAIELGLFSLIVESDKPRTAVELSQTTGAEEQLIVRIMRAISGFGFVDETGDNVWRANPQTHAMAQKPIQAAHIHIWDQCTTTMAKMLPFLAQTGWKCPTDAHAGAFQYAFDTDKEVFEYWHEIPAVMQNFNTFMTGNRGSRPAWTEWYPVRERVIDGFDAQDGDGVLLVDVAGGRGHDVEHFLRKMRDEVGEEWKGRLVLEDLPKVIEDISELNGRIEKVKYDFFTPQPIKGARTYFFRFVFHDWSDELCLKILENLVPAMKRGHSKVLFNEIIIPNRDSPMFYVGMDMSMMAMHTAKERSEKDWVELLAKAGLKVNKIWPPPGYGEGIVEAELA
ncbi:S-adenosyl-L-methionine-dependent methyltransferase [Lineolata rhizophorae]|uniref:S-adenosyl-L-methionine-dependent methyltransferase n=1 Tax=Lineolata rhizophorae TaxID=578093 RepID=A0A6A6NZJ7_9PEZI|nr:S-adenosyl-L-methionine-dependent methyltransferase [Lineolata rhizophorae]